MNLLKKNDGNHNIISSYWPFEGRLLLEKKGYYRVSQVYTSNAPEGFAHTETETNILLEDGLTAGGKPLRDIYAILGHARAYGYMFTLSGQKN